VLDRTPGCSLSQAPCTSLLALPTCITPRSIAQASFCVNDSAPNALSSELCRRWAGRFPAPRTDRRGWHPPSSSRRRATRCTEQSALRRQPPNTKRRGAASRVRPVCPSSAFASIAGAPCLSVLCFCRRLHGQTDARMHEKTDSRCKRDQPWPVSSVRLSGSRPSEKLSLLLRAASHTAQLPS
jgi:hypothetical protein